MTVTNQIKTEEKKQHFDDIYLEPDPVAFKVRIIDELNYISDDFNRQAFDRLILSWCREQLRKSSGNKSLHYVDLCSCFGNTTLSIAHGMTTDEIRENWKDKESCSKILRPRRIPLSTTGIDISGSALAYGKKAGIFDYTIEANLNEPNTETREEIHACLKKADILVSTASLVYLEIPTIQGLVSHFSRSDKEGYMLVNFLNPFSLEKSDATKRLLLDSLDFVGSAATRHRKLSPLERKSYPEEEWALLEIWVLKRR